MKTGIYQVKKMFVMSDTRETTINRKMPIFRSEM